MSEQSWTPLFRTSHSTVTKVMKSPAFAASREQAAISIADPAALRALAVTVLELDFEDAPLSAIADRVAAAVRFLKAKANRLETAPVARLGAGDAARERLLVAALHYLITPIDMVPDFRVGGYIDDVMLLSWIFGATHVELEPFLPKDPD